MTPENFLTEIVLTDIWYVAKLFVMFFMLIYLGFAVIVVRQVGLMIHVLNDKLDWALRAGAWLHLLLAVLVLILAWVLL